MMCPFFKVGVNMHALHKVINKTYCDYYHKHNYGRSI